MPCRIFIHSPSLLVTNVGINELETRGYCKGLSLRSCQSLEYARATMPCHADVETCSAGVKLHVTKLSFECDRLYSIEMTHTPKLPLHDIIR